MVSFQAQDHSQELIDQGGSHHSDLQSLFLFFVFFSEV